MTGSKQKFEIVGKIDDNDITPVTVGDPDAIDSLAIDQSDLEDFGDLEEMSPVVECRRPPRGHYFTVLPETDTPWKNRGLYWLLQIEGRDPYLVDPKIAKEKQSEEDTLRPVLIVRFVTMAGEEGLWPLKLNPQDGGKGNVWNTSAHNILKAAESGRWVRMVTGKKNYRLGVSPKTFDETPPKFSDRTFKELRDVAFADRVVTTLDHEIWTVLKDGSTK
jgi:hypothetical protein